MTPQINRAFQTLMEVPEFQRLCLFLGITNGILCEANVDTVRAMTGDGFTHADFCALQDGLERLFRQLQHNDARVAAGTAP